MTKIDVIAVARSVLADAQRMFAPLTVEQLNWKSSPAEWSVGQCLDHLMRLNTSYFPQFERIIKGEKSTSVWDSLPLWSRFWGTLFVDLVDPAFGIKFKAPAPYIPTYSKTEETIVEDFVTHQQRLIDLLERMKKLDWQAATITSTIAPFITYSLLDCGTILVKHEQRHLRQAGRIMKTPGFPETIRSITHPTP
jgi:hypothetical protein